MKTREEFIAEVKSLLQFYMDNFYRYDSNPQLRIIPSTLSMSLENGSDLYNEIEDSDEAVENAALAQRPADEDADDNQVKRNPDLVPVKSLLKKLSDDREGIDMLAVTRLAGKYYKDGSLDPQ